MDFFNGLLNWPGRCWVASTGHAPCPALGVRGEGFRTSGEPLSLRVSVSLRRAPKSAFPIIKIAPNSLIYNPLTKPGLFVSFN